MKIGIFEIFFKRLMTVSVLAIFVIVIGLTAISALTTYTLMTQTLTVNKSGTGANHGSVTSTPAGIDCGSTCSTDFNDGEIVMLSPSTPAGGFTTFAGWGGACDGTGSCMLTMDAAKNVTARFNDAAVLQKCTLENPASWGLRFRLTGTAVSPSGCRAKCIAAGGNGNFSINAPLGWCVCGTERQPQSTQPATTGCDVNCPGGPYSCGGTTGQFSTYVVAAPSAASVSISGRVLTDTKRGLMNAAVYLTDASGTVHSARTSAFGYYRFADISAGQTVTILVVSKRYQFDAQAVTITEEIENLDFAASSLLLREK
jgi:hypothetical protein